MSGHSVLVTGASGFVGGALCKALVQRGIAVTASCRGPATRLAGVRYVPGGNINSATNWQEALAGLDCVVHCAAISRVSGKSNAEGLGDYLAVNYEGTVALAEQAAAKGIKRFVFLSSALVHGDSTDHRQPFSISDTPAPVECYAISKWKAEQALTALGHSSGMEVVILRPVLVYGPGVAGNFARLLKLASLGLPLPFAKITNKRSMMALDNLLDLILVCLDHPEASGQAFLASDGVDLSTPELMLLLGHCMQRPPRLFSLPRPLMMNGAKLLGLDQVARRLLGSFQVDITHTRQVLGWSPPLTSESALKKTVEWYLSRS